MANKTEYEVDESINAIVKDYDTLKQMEVDGQLKPFSNYFIKDEDENLGQMRTKILWTNPNPTSSFASQTITISSNDYDYLVLIPTHNISNQIKAPACIMPKGTGGRIVSADASSSSTYIPMVMARDVTRVSDTQFTISNCRYNYGSTYTETRNDLLVPYQIIGLYKQPAMIYTGAELHEGNGISIKDGVISTTNSNDSQVLLYSSSGVNSGTITLGDISPYKFITIATSDDNNFKTINVYSVKSLLYMINNNGFGIYGYSSNYINCTCLGSINNFSLNLISYASQKIIAIWGVK